MSSYIIMRYTTYHAAATRPSQKWKAARKLPAPILAYSAASPTLLFGFSILSFTR